MKKKGISTSFLIPQSASESCVSPVPVLESSSRMVMLGARWAHCYYGMGELFLTV